MPAVSLATALMWSVGGCSSSKSVTGTTPSHTSLTISPESLFLFVGDSAALTASVLDATGAAVPQPNIVWTCDNPAVASVSNMGLVRALTPGSARARAASGSVASSIQLTVVAPTCALSGQVGYVAPSAYTAPSGATCDVATSADVAKCIAQLLSGSVNLVRLTTLVQCDTTNPCNIELANITRPVTIFGAPGSGAGILRSGGYESPLIWIHDSQHVTLANLTLDEGPADTSCDRRARTGDNPCASTINLRDGTDVTLDRMILRNAQEHAVSILHMHGVTLQDSQIYNASVFGVWTGNDDPTHNVGVLLENNLIQDVRTNGIFLSYTDSSIVRHNTLNHNHHIAIFTNCGGLCPGGQLDMIGNSRLTVVGNQIINGVIDANNAPDRRPASSSTAMSAMR